MGLLAVDDVRHCKRCKKDTPHLTNKPPGMAYDLMATVWTLGLYLPFWWLFARAGNPSRSKCKVCGKKSWVRNK